MSPQRADEAALRLAAIVESSDDAIVSKDLDGIITSWNRAAERLFGYTAAEAVGQPIRLIVPPDRQHEVDDVLSRIRAGTVDDDEDALALLREVLEAAGAEVTTAASGTQALDLIERSAPHVLVADIGMPGMDGFEFIRRVRHWPAPSVSQVPAAALTAYARSEDRTQALRSGFQMHLAKPIDPNELVTAIAALARRRDSASPSP